MNHQRRADGAAANGRTHPAAKTAWGGTELVSVALIALSALFGLVGPPLEAELWRPRFLWARFAGERLPGDRPLIIADGSLPVLAPVPPAPPSASRLVRPAAPPGFGPVTVWPALPASTAGFVWATPGWITQEWGCTDFELEPWDADRRCRFHHGIDIGNLAETPIVAAAAGTVAWTGWRDDGYGYSVLIDHGGGVATRYGHFCCPPPLKIGQELARGDPIGQVGSTGASSGAHLHFAIEVDGRDIDPRTALPSER